MQNRVLGRLVIGSLLMFTALAGAPAVFTPDSAVAAKQATSPAVHAIELALKGEFSDAFMAKASAPPLSGMHPAGDRCESSLMSDFRSISTCCRLLPSVSKSGITKLKQDC